MSNMQPDWIEHATSISLLVGFFIMALFSLVSWLMIRTISKIDANQTELFRKYNNHEHRLSALEGSHAARTGMKLNCTVEDD